MVTVLVKWLLSCSQSYCDLCINFLYVVMSNKHINVCIIVLYASHVFVLVYCNNKKFYSNTYNDFALTYNSAVVVLDIDVVLSSLAIR